MFTALLLEWFDINRRDLPWRHTQDPYAIWLSEVILQQTRIAQGTAYWQKFMARFPSVESLAAATEDEVLRLWQGLGYYSRARNLRIAAQQVVDMGGFPSTFLELKRLKGVGDYTAAAVASFAFGQPIPAVDGNVYRVLARHYGISTPIDSTEGKKEFFALAQSLMSKTRPADFNQAMMDLGATLCMPTAKPDCSVCPLVDSCVAFREGRIAALPVKAKHTKVATRYLSYIYIRCNDEVAIHRRGAGDIWQGLWEPVLVENAPVPNYGETAELLCHHVKHVLTHRVIYADFYLVETKIKPTLSDGFIWVKESALDDYAKSRLFEILLERLI